MGNKNEYRDSSYPLADSPNPIFNLSSDSLRDRKIKDKEQKAKDAAKKATDEARKELDKKIK